MILALVQDPLQLWNVNLWVEKRSALAKCTNYFNGLGSVSTIELNILNGGFWVVKKHEMGSDSDWFRLVWWFSQCVNLTVSILWSSLGQNRICGVIFTILCWIKIFQSVVNFGTKPNLGGVCIWLRVRCPVSLDTCRPRLPPNRTIISIWTKFILQSSQF